MRLGLAGSHRTGKTSLAKAISQTTGVPFVETSTSAVFKHSGLHPATPLEFKTRLWIQQRILQAAVAVWQTMPDAFVTDRTPIDFMAYTLADIQGATVVDFADLEEYLTHCFKITNQFFTKLVVVQPAIPLVPDDGKAALNKAYMEHLNTIILGLCNDERLRCPAVTLTRQILSLEERVKWVCLEI
jgi:predicted ATPase